MRGLERLHDQLWSGPLPDPDAPQQAIRAALPGAGYAQVLAALQRLCNAALPLEGALAEALERWPWSIDLALVMAEAAADEPARERALATLATRIVQQNRRRAAYGWAAWRAGNAGTARAFMDGIDPASESLAADLACRAELAMLDADWKAAEADIARLHAWPERAQRLILQRLSLREGPMALARHVETTPGLAGAHWRLVFDLFLAERDFDRARHLLDHRPDGAAQDPAEHLAAKIQLALDCDDPQAALTHLTPTLAPDPWRWSPRQHVQWLRATLGLARLETAPHRRLCTARQHAEAALRLHARNAVLRGLWLTCRELTDDWDTLARDLRAAPARQGWPVAQGLNRLGLHDHALARLHDDLQGIDGANPRARRLLALAETRLLSGDPVAALEALASAEALAPPAPTRADLALLRAEVFLWQGRPEPAETALAGLCEAFAQRMGLWLTLARIAFFKGNFARAGNALERFRTLKTAQTGTPPPADLRDRIVADALRASRDLPAGTLALPPHQLVARLGVARIAASPGLSAHVIARSRMMPASRFTPVAGPPIPRRIAHYWEGRRSAAVERGIAAWRNQHPGFASSVFGPAEAVAWLETHHPALAPLFDRQRLPATRADIFRIALMATEGGLYADVDEYPRAPVNDWLSGASAVFCVESGHGTIANNFLAARPGLPLFDRMLERVQALLASTDTPYPWWHSGPAPLTASVFEALFDPRQAPGLRLLDQSAYCRRVSTNLPFPHKRSALHWR